jgi:hypothetical protein
MPCPHGYIIIANLENGAGWLVENCPNLDKADESDKDRYAKDLRYPFI